MPNPVTQFQILAKHPDAVATFFAKVFGWTVDAGNPLFQNVLGYSLPVFLVNALALIGSWCFSAYLMIGRRLRAGLTLTLYIWLAYGIAALFREVSARTEQYWCPIKHASGRHNRHSRYHLFVDYGDADRVCTLLTC